MQVVPAAHLTPSCPGRQDIAAGNHLGVPKTPRDVARKLPILQARVESGEHISSRERHICGFRPRWPTPRVSCKLTCAGSEDSSNTRDGVIWDPVVGPYITVT